MLRYADGDWLPDDGETPDLAFVTNTHASAPFAFYVTMPYYTNLVWGWRDIELERRIVGRELEKFVYGWHHQTTNNKDCYDYRWQERDKHPNEIAGRAAMDKCCSMFSCANGRGANLTHEEPESPYFTKGLLWVKSTMTPLKKPENPACFLCLDDAEGHKREASRRRYEDILSSKTDAEERLDKVEIELYDIKDELEHYAKKLEELKTAPFYNPEWDKV
jgi:hypothetical protein